MRRIPSAITLVLLLATALLTTVIVRAQVVARPADQNTTSSLIPHPGEQSDVQGLSSLPDWDFSEPLVLSTEAVPAPNDTCQDPITVTLASGANQYAVQLDTTEATTGPHDPAQSCTIGGPAVNAKSVWWSLRVPEDGELNVSTVTENPLRYDTVVTLYPGNTGCESLSPAQELACDDDTYAFQSQLSSLVDAGQWYLVEVTGWGLENPGGELDVIAYFQTNTRWMAPPGAGMPKRLHRHTAVTDGVYLYFLGGQDPYLSSTVYRYSPETATWNVLEDLPAPYSNSDGAYLDGRIYLPSGYAGGPSLEPYQGVHYTYVITDETWTTSAPMTSTGTLSEPVAWGATAADPDRGLYYYTGGRYGTDPGQPLDLVVEYTAGTDTWRSLPPMLTPRYAHEAVFIANQLCVAGGLDQDANPLTGAECFDPATESWSTIPDLHIPRSMFGSAVGSDGRWYVFGGLTVNTITETLTTPKTERYDPQTNTWTPFDQHWSLNQSRDWLTGTSIGVEIFAAGGFLPIEGFVVDSFEELVIREPGSHASYIPLINKGLPSETGTLHEPNNAIPDAFGPLSSGTELMSDFGYAWDTEDFFYLDTSATTDIHVNLSQIPAGSNYDLYLYGTDESGNPKSLLAISQQGSNLDESIVVNQVPAGRYHIRVRNAWRIPSSQPYEIGVVY